ncbi:cysteine hydrolase family protein [Shewanella cyperi]|uniref:cysteine hydrolase family protein n=1 Tax=Shewanella cyperi TaxID=2814292 RepID=UPI001A950671|nr:cysteine hydrolase family protein [Shewanella cyperi]QSX39546.1 cysteine hydrolase [Shewanella cyperi]
MTKALLVIDVQKLLFENGNPPHEAHAVIDRINSLSQQARDSDMPVIFIQHEQEGTPIARDSDGWQLATGLVAEEDDFRVGKSTPDSFNGTGLKSLLDELDVTELVICGYASEFCVDTTVRRALALGYPVTLVTDAHTTANKPHLDAASIIAHHNATLCSIKSFGVVATGVSTNDWLAE